jgi:hypothetical protein
VQLHGGVLAVPALALGQGGSVDFGVLAEISMTVSLKPTTVSPITLIG